MPQDEPTSLAEAFELATEAYNAPPMETPTVPVPRAVLRFILKSNEPADSDN